MSPLEKIQEAAYKIVEGNYDVEITATTFDELRRPVKEFNYRARKVKSYQDLNFGKIRTERSEAMPSGKAWLMVSLSSMKS